MPPDLLFKRLQVRLKPDTTGSAEAGHYRFG